jgi:chemotaxis protein methyltransferase CheR
MCRIPISRFYPDRGVFDAFGQQLLPEAAAAVAARNDDAVKCWSAGCASGEEPNTLAMVWRFCIAQGWPTLGFAMIGTDADDILIERAKAACYDRSSLKDLSPQLVEQGLHPVRPAVLPQGGISGRRPV